RRQTVERDRPVALQHVDQRTRGGWLRALDLEVRGRSRHAGTSNARRGRGSDSHYWIAVRRRRLTDDGQWALADPCRLEPDQRREWVRLWYPARSRCCLLGRQLPQGSAASG